MTASFPQVTRRSSRGAALIIVLAFVVLVTAVVIAYFSRTTTDRQLAQSSFNDTSADLFARSAIDITVSDVKHEIAIKPVTAANIQPQRYGDDVSIPNLIRRSSQGDPTGRTSNIPSTAPSANGRAISFARWNSHYLIPVTATFSAPNWVLVTAQGPDPSPTPSAVIGRYALAMYDEGGLIDMNVGGAPTFASLTRPTRRRPTSKHPLEKSEILLAGQVPKLTPANQSGSATQGSPVSFSPSWNQHPDSYGFTGSLPAGLSLSTTTGVISGTATSSGTFSLQLTATNGSGTGSDTFPVTITGRSAPDSTPWPVNLARKGIVAFADLTTLPSTPPATAAQINKLVGWRNYAITQQPTSASFDNPSFTLPPPDNYAHYFLGAVPPVTLPFTTVSTAVVNNRTDQAVVSRQELIKLQRSIGFSQSLLQYLGTFSREQNRPAPDWPNLNGNLSARWDMNNLGIVIPDSWIQPGNNGQGHAYGKQRHSDIGRLFGLTWVSGTFANGSRFTSPNYYGRWKYTHTLNPTSLPADPDFFQIIDYAMCQANGGTPDPNHVRNTLTIGAALIDQYDTDDLYDPDPNLPTNGNAGNTITIIDTKGNALPGDYVYGIEAMSLDDPNFNLARPPSAPPPPPGYVLLNRRFENVGEFGYAYNPASTTASKTLDFASSARPDRALLDFFTYNAASRRAGIVNLNTRNAPVLASIIRGAILSDPGSENTPTVLVSQDDALSAGQAVVAATTAAGGAALNRADVARLAAAAAAAVPDLAGSDEAKQTIARALAETGQTRTWNLMIDVIAQTGKYAPGTTDLTDPTKFIVLGEKRYWLHIGLDRDDGTVLGQQLEAVYE
jgi:hypothetical protein